MKFKFIDPEIIMSVVVALIILSVGIFAFMVTVTNIPVSTPVGSAVETTATHTISDTTTYEFITVSSNAINSTTVCVLEGYNATRGWVTLQSGATINGTFIDTNNTFRVNAGTAHAGNTSFRLTYDVTGSATTTLENRTHNALYNVSGTGESVFNIIGIVLIIGAIMTIIGLVYSYMRPKY